MIKNYLEKKGYPVLKNSLRDSVESIVYYSIATNIIKECLIEKSTKTKGTQAFNLDWSDGNTTTITIPAFPQKVKEFITPTLNGCSVGVKFHEKTIDVYHKNFGDERLPVANADVYPEDVDFWVVPQDCTAWNGGNLKPLVHYVPFTVFWGEFEEDGWHFYIYGEDRKIIEIFQNGGSEEVPVKSGGCTC